jgi:hypothetical protein
MPAMALMQVRRAMLGGGFTIGFSVRLASDFSRIAGRWFRLDVRPGNSICRDWIGRIAKL